MTVVGERLGPVRRLWRWLTTPVRAGWRWLTAQKSLGHALVIVVAIGLLGALVALVVVSWVLGQGWLWTSATQDTSRLDVTKLALTVVGGAGAIVALTVAYRRQKDIEDGRFTERFGAAAAQLGADTPAERLAGVYAMAGVADRYPMFGQQCIDVLCGYLRLPFDPDPAVSHLTNVVRHHRLTADGDRTVDRTYQLLPNDREVRDTIVRVIAAHVQADRETGWHEQDFDLTGATLTTAPFDHSHFRGTLNCRRVTFTDVASFNAATFTGAAWFNGATFTGDAMFNGARFNSYAWFHEATFTGDVPFGGATFSGDTRFTLATFHSVAWFSGATFNDGARFDEARFNGAAWFSGATFTGAAWFNEATFNDGARFDEARFNSATWFNEATFTGSLVRRDATAAEGTAMLLGTALGFPDPEPLSEPDPQPG